MLGVDGVHLSKCLRGTKLSSTMNVNFSIQELPGNSSFKTTFHLLTALGMLVSFWLCPILLLCETVCLFFITSPSSSLHSHLQVSTSYLERPSETDPAIITPTDSHGHQGLVISAFCCISRLCSQRDRHSFRVSQLSISSFSDEDKTEKKAHTSRTLLDIK